MELPDTALGELGVFGYHRPAHCLCALRPPMTDSPEHGRITYRGVATQWHCDHVGHLNIAHYVSRFDEAHWAFFADIGLTATWLRAHGRGMAAVEQALRYLREVKAGDTVTIRSKLIEVKTKVVVSDHTMILDANGEVCATERITCALVDLQARKATAIPEELRANMLGQLAGDRA